MNKVNDSFMPVYVDNDLDPIDKINDIDSEILIVFYDEILKYMPYHKNIRYFTNAVIDHKIINKKITINTENIKYKGLLVLDIDDVITNINNYEYIKDIIKKSNENNIKIILLTARQCPFSYGHKNNQIVDPIKNILNNIDFDYNKYVIDIWYNPNTFINGNVPIQKMNSIKFISEIYNIKKNNIIFFDDTLDNLNESSSLGIKTNLVYKNEGINLKNLEFFLTFLNNLT